MAATDQTYRPQKTLDIVFAVSGILMLLSIVGMFAQDYFRQFKVEQRQFRDVEAAMAERALFDLPTFPRKQLDELLVAEKNKDTDGANAAREALNDYIDGFANLEKTVHEDAERVSKDRAEAANAVHQAEVDIARHDAAYRNFKAQSDSKESLYNIAVDERDHAGEPASAAWKDLDTRVQELLREVNALHVQRDREKVAVEDATERKRQAEAKAAEADKLRLEVEAKYKQKRADFDRFTKLIAQKRWSVGDWLRSQPVLDAFASPYRIQQYTLNELPIDYSFKYVTRFDRCTTCHLGMDRAAYEPTALDSLTKKPEQLQAELDRFRQILNDRRKANKSNGGFNPDDLPSQVATLSSSQLTPGRVKEFAAHPRLDLFVDSNSPHPMEQFGCSACHGGQGSATDFFYAAHTPNTAEQKEHWENEYNWGSSHFWDYPMQPNRFVESGCVKCHHQITDLIRYDNKVEAPKLVRGYNLLRDNGCFGCHEISSLKAGREIGPDVRLEPGIPLDKMDPAERAKVEADKLNPPGTFRKVGPSLFRISEKTNADWMRRWIWSPRGFRPDTKMPHFYGLSNHNPDVLKDVGQEDFPTSEVDAIVYYLRQESDNYLKGGNNDIYRRTNEALVKYYTDKEREEGQISETERKEKADAERRLDRAEAPLLELRQEAHPLTQQMVTIEGQTVQLPEAPKDNKAVQDQLTRGRKLFSERGCLACHTHKGTSENGTPEVPTVTSEASFGPNLSDLAAKLGVTPGDRESARRWLVQWILNPQLHHPRTRMPYTHLTVEQAADVAAWLLSQTAERQGIEPPPVADEIKAYRQMAELYLAKGKTKQEIRDLLYPEDLEGRGRAKNWLKRVRPDIDEAVFQGYEEAPPEEQLGKLKWYVGRKAISRLGCFGCHNIPGFETAKPIGTPLNDWGRKDPERLAFEDIDAYVRDHHAIVPEGVVLTQKQEARRQELLGKGALNPVETEELHQLEHPYDAFFSEALNHRTRMGFLQQKLREPRSYDYHRRLAWDDRLRMPQFQFARRIPLPQRKQGEEDEAYVKRLIADFKQNYKVPPSPRLKEESVEDYLKRLEEDYARQEEAEAREAVMTFVLGLVAEPVPARYQSNPTGDRLAEVRGRKVLEQANCIGCHQVRPGVYEFKKTPENLARLEDAYSSVVGNLKSDYIANNPHVGFFTNDNAWGGPPAPWPDRLQVRAVNFHMEEGDEHDVPVVTLSEALRFPKPGQEKEKDFLELPAGNLLQLPDQLLTRQATFGGTFADIMVGYLSRRNPQEFSLKSGDNDNARAVLPPQLIREGERTQPDWLFQFLRDPGVIRPEARMLLRMPKFNLSDEDFMILVNYFNAVDRLRNEGIGLQYPYAGSGGHDEVYWREKTASYSKKLGKERLEERAKRMQPLWEAALQDQVDDAKRRLAAAEEAVKAAKDGDARKLAESQRDQAQQVVKAAEERAQKKDVSELRRDWEATGVYAADAYRLLTNHGSPCLQCHQVGHTSAAETKGPNLNLSAGRLRPEWTRRWLANPARMMYPTIMPQNFPNDKQQYTDIFDGSSLEQLTAVRDVLVNYAKVADRPENRYYRGEAPGETK